MNTTIMTNNPTTLFREAESVAKDPAIKLIAQALRLMHEQQVLRDQSLAEAVQALHRYPETPS